MKSSLRDDQGFTLVELLIVTAIVGILAAVAIPTYLHFVERAKLISSVSSIKVVQKDLEAYVNDKGSYPSSINFTDFTDQDGTSVLFTGQWNIINSNLYSWDSYTLNGNAYILVAKAKDSNQTVITLKPTEITY